MQFVEVVFEGAAALRPQCRTQHLLDDERVAVAITADPAADAQKGRQAIREHDVLAGELRFEVAVETWQLGEERIIVIGEAVGHLIDHAQPRTAQQIGLPQGQHRAA